MSELISDKQAAIAFIDGKQVEFMDETGQWRIVLNNTVLKVFLDRTCFRLKPRTITINGIEVPAPFDPMHSEKYFYLNLQRECLYAAKEFNGNHSDNSAVELGAWRTEEEIKQVVAALRQVFGGAK